MFAQLNPGTSVRQRRVLAGSLALHALLFAWLLHNPEPRLLTLVSVAIGHNGKVVSRLYFPTRSSDDSNTSSSDRATEVYRHQRLGHEKLSWKPTSTKAKLPLPSSPPTPSAAEDNAKIAMLSKLGHGAQAGLPYGGLPGGPVYGDEIRPALPVAMPDPVVYPWQLPESEGNVEIEFTIDERGDVVRTIVTKSMGPTLDEKALEAAKNWHFQPATHNGVAIASKQDYIFHFRAKG
jgi:TonB family protein